MNINLNQRTLQYQFYKPSANFSNPYSKISFKGAEKDAVMILKKEENSLPAKLRTMYLKILKHVSPSATLKSMGICEEQAEKILSSMGKPALIKYFKTMISELPKIEDKELLGDFIYYRTLASEDNEHRFYKDAFNSFNNIYNSNPSLHNSTSLELLKDAIIRQNRGAENLSEVEKYIDKDEHANHYLKVLTMDTYRKCKNGLAAFKTFTELGCEKSHLLKVFESYSYPFNQGHSVKGYDIVIERLKNLQNQGLDSEYLLPMLQEIYEEKDLIKLCDFMKKAEEKRSLLGGTDETIEKFDIIKLFIEDNRAKETLNLLSIWGEDTLLNTFSEGYDKIGDYLVNCGDIRYNHKYMQPFIKLINPTNSEEYIELSDKLKSLKSKFGSIKDDADKERLIDEINTLSKQRNGIIKNSIKDTKEKLNANLVYFGLLDPAENLQKDYERANSIVPFMNPKCDEEKKLYKEKLNELLWEEYKLEIPESLEEKLNFANSKYLEKMFFPSDDFFNNFKSLIKILSKSKKNIANTLNNLPQNKQLAETLKEEGLSYKVWTGSLPDLKVEFDIQYDFDSMSKNVIKNLEAEFNDVIYKSLPEQQRKSIEKTLLKFGYSFAEKEEAIYVDNGFYDGRRKTLRLFKDEKPIEFNDLSKIFKILEKEFNTDAFWETEHSASSVNNAKSTFKDHIGTRHTEMKVVRQHKKSETSHIQIQKVDMNDIKHSLFLGNDAACCTAIGSCNDWSAPNYIKNKMVQAIELKDGDEYIGNTMIFLVNVYGKPGLLLDNIELKPKYQYNDRIEQGIIDFVKKFTEKLGAPNMDIYASQNRHKLDMKNFELAATDKIQFIGSTADDLIYLDTMSDETIVDESLSLDRVIYKLKP